MPPRRILLVEDDVLFAAMATAWLTDAGHVVEHVSEGPAALEAAERHRPDLVLTDVVLPGGMDGLGIVAALRLRGLFRSLPVVVMSSRQETREAALAVGANRFLLKPCDAAALQSTVAALLAPPRRAKAPPGPPARPGALELDLVQAAEGELGEEGGWTVLEGLETQGASGVLEVSGEGGPRLRLHFDRGRLVGARSSDPSTAFGEILRGLRLLSPADLDELARLGRREGLPLGMELRRAGLLDRQSLDRALREQVLRRAMSLVDRVRGAWTFATGTRLGFAGYPVPVAALRWRAGRAPLAGVDRAAPSVRLVREGHAAWPLFDPDDRHLELRARLRVGVTPGDPALSAEAALLLDHLADAGLLGRVAVAAPACPPPAQDTRDRVLAAWRTLADAPAYTLLGLTPGEAAAEGAAEAAGFVADQLPVGVDGSTRRRARVLEARARAAARLLGDRERRSVYDARLGGQGRAETVPLRTGGDAALLAERAREMIARGAPLGACALLAEATAEEPVAPALLALRGWARHLACPEDPDAGRDDLEAARRVDPEEPWVLVALARVALRGGAIAGARRLFREALTSAPGYEPARVGLRALER